MKSEYAAAIVASLELAAERGGDLTEAVYARLFAQQPEMLPLFVMDTDGSVRGEMLARVFDAILDFIGERRYAHRLIEAEAMNHEGYNVPRTVFVTFFDMVAETVRDACGPGWTETMGQAWAQMLSEMSAYVRLPA